MTQAQAERWLPVVGFEGRYEVSDHGRVRSLDRTVRNGYPGTTRRARGRLLKTSTSVRGGYPVVGFLGPGKIQTIKVHRLVLEAFVGPAGDGEVARHLDGNPTNNRVENLRWGTMKENSEDMVRHGRSNRGERCPLSRLTEEKVRLARRLYAAGVAQEDIAERLNVVQGTVSCAIRGVSWAWVDEPIPQMRSVGGRRGSSWSLDENGKRQYRSPEATA